MCPRPLAALRFNSKKRWEHISGEEGGAEYEFAVHPSHLLSWHDDEPSRGKSLLGSVDFRWVPVHAQTAPHTGDTREKWVFASVARQMS